ncbi:MAG: alkaline phosphatase PhoX [Phycisphaerales bacterium]
MKTQIRASMIVAVAGLAAAPAFAQVTGPSSSQSPYVLPTLAGVTTTSILTVGDSVGGYRMVGIPDGMGALASATSGNFSLFVNHELGASVGAVRAHGQTGAFVSRWEIDSSLNVIAGRDHNTSSADAFEYSTGTGTWSNAPSPAQRWGRFCSADLAAPSAYKFGNLGTDARLFLNGEEIGNEGRAYAHIVSGPNVNQTWHLPHLGRFSWENAVASPFAQQKTIVFGLDDSSPGQNYLYIGNKTDTGNDIERAGLTNGSLYGIRVSGLPTETRPQYAGGRFDLFNHGNVANTTGLALQNAGNANGVTNFLRPEDGQWDPRPGHENDFYFVTTDRYNVPGTSPGNSRLYRMSFDDITNPTAGGEITLLIDGALSGPQMMDNMTIDSLGRVLIQEDIGGQDALSKIWLYDIATGGLAQVAQHDPARFSPGGASFLTRDEESSGIIDAKDTLGLGWFLLNVQAHYGIPGELVEGGQLLAMYVDPSIVPTPGAASLLGLAGLVGLRRRR